MSKGVGVVPGLEQIFEVRAHDRDLSDPVPGVSQSRSGPVPPRIERGPERRAVSHIGDSQLGSNRRRARESPTHGQKEPCPLPEDFRSSTVVDPARLRREDDPEATVGNDSRRVPFGTGDTLGVSQSGDRLPFARVGVVAVRAGVSVVRE